MGALFPPFYLAASGVRTAVLGIPFAIAYWIVDALVLMVGLWVYYAVERVRGELDDDEPDDDVDPLSLLSSSTSAPLPGVRS